MQGISYADLSIRISGHRTEIMEIVMEQFPIRLRGQKTVVAIRLPEPMGGSAKIFLRSVAREHLSELFHQPIECGISGRSDIGQPIPINSVGRWLFGVPGYRGHVVVSNWEGCLRKVEFPAGSPHVVGVLVEALKREVESLHTRTR